MTGGEETMLQIARKRGLRRLGAVRLLLACAGFTLASAWLPALGDTAGFQKRLRSDNAAHLEAVWPVLRQAPSSMIDASVAASDATGPWELRQGALHVSVELKRTTPIDLSGFPVPVLTVTVQGTKVATVEGTESQPDSASFLAQVVEMDPSNAYPEIVFSSYTGGAHCCSQTWIVSAGRDGKSWKMIDAGLFDGGPLAANDVDGDGRFELVTRDNRFLYAFGCYACSAAPLQILRVEKGTIVDASAEQSYRDAHGTNLAAIVQAYDGGSAESNGFFAGYVGQKIRLGEGRQAWEFMQANYDRSSDWGLDACSVKFDAQGNCPGKTIRLTFPQALKRFLADAGYPLPE